MTLVVDRHRPIARFCLLPCAARLALSSPSLPFPPSRRDSLSSACDDMDVRQPRMLWPDERAEVVALGGLTAGMMLSPVAS
jgi:hypothetical protein